MAKFGDAIRSLLEREHMSQREFARQSGLSLSNVVRILKLDSATVNGTTYRMIADAFGMTPAQLDRHWRPGMRSLIPAGGIDRGIPILADIPCGAPTNEQVSEARGFISRGAVQVEDAAEAARGRGRTRAAGSQGQGRGRKASGEQAASSKGDAGSG